MITTSGRVTQSAFGRTADGHDVTRFTLDGGGMRLAVLDFGATVQSLHVPDRQGRGVDVVLGYDDVSSYERDPLYVGVIVGRYANRIRGAQFTLDGQHYRLSANDGPHHLHGGLRGFGKVMWKARSFENPDTVGVILEYASPDGEEGYPGNVDMQVTYALSGATVLSVEYRAASDKPTPVNPTHHSYFNLGGEGSGDVLEHELMIRADRFTEIDGSRLPTGTIAPVAGTPMDFRLTRRIGDRIGDGHEQMRLAGGYDHNFVVRRGDATLALAADVSDPRSGIAMAVFTTEPGVQFYSGNFGDIESGKNGRRYGPHSGFCLETQHFPDSPNHAHFPSTILRPGNSFRSRTEFRFSVT